MHTKYYKVAGITIQFDSELPINDATLAPKFKLFEVKGPGGDNVHLVHRFSLPERIDFGQQIYKKSPWVIYKNDHEWVYVLEASPDPTVKKIRQISFASLDHTRMEIYNSDLIESAYQQGHMGSLTMAPTDQILLARVLADRGGCYFHADGVDMDGKGFLFVGHSGAGKSTIATLLQDKAEILCDDRMIVRRWPDGYQIHGNWSHGTLPIVSANSAPLKAIFFLEKAENNAIVPVKNRMEAVSTMLGCLIRPMVTPEWWKKMLTLVEDIAASTPCYRLRFDKSGDIYQVLRKL